MCRSFIAFFYLFCCISAARIFCVLLLMLIFQLQFEKHPETLVMFLIFVHENSECGNEYLSLSSSFLRRLKSRWITSQTCLASSSVRRERSSLCSMTLKESLNQSKKQSIKQSYEVAVVLQGFVVGPLLLVTRFSFFKLYNLLKCKDILEILEVMNKIF